MRRLLPLAAALLLFLSCATMRAQQRPKVGLVLGGGGAKGAAEVGVLKIIEQEAVPIDYIAGTSIGAVIGALYAAGYRSEELDSMFRSEEWISLFTGRNTSLSNEPYSEHEGTTYIFGFPVWKSKEHPDKDGPAGEIGLINGDSITSLFRRMIQDTPSWRYADITSESTFDSLPIPFRCVAFDLTTDKEKVLGRGDLPLAMRASMSIPGLFKPTRWGSHRLVDGGIINNLPVDVVREMGADIVIAIDLTQNRNQKEKDFSLKEWTGVGGVLNYIVSRPDIKKYKENLNHIDLYINPPLDDNAASFNPSSINLMIAAGKEEGRKHIKAMREIKKADLPQR